MLVRFFLVIVALVGAFASTTADAQVFQDVPASVRSDGDADLDLNLDMLGLRIGSSAVSARRILEARGYLLRNFETGLSWYGIVGEQTRTSVERRYRNSVTAAFFDGPSGENLSLHFVQTPRGAALARAQLQYPSTLTNEALRSALASSLGPPNCEQGWCFKSPDLVGKKQSSSFTRWIADSDTRTITLDGKARLEPMLEISVAEAVKDCRQLRLGVALLPDYFIFAC